MDRSILKTGIPAAIVASVLGFSLLFPAVASRGISQSGDKHGYGEKCGYGQVQDNDENDDHGEMAKHDNDCNDDEDDNSGGGGGDHGIRNQNQAAAVPAAPLVNRIVIGGGTRSPGETE